MIISSKGRNAVRIMCDVARNYGGAPVKIADIAGRSGITVKYTEQIAGQLSKCGLLKSVRGAQGGYVLSKRPEEYTAWEIIINTEGDLLPAACAVENQSCGYAENCESQRLWRGLYRTIKEYLEKITLKDLLEGGAEAGDFYQI